MILQIFWYQLIFNVLIKLINHYVSSFMMRIGRVKKIRMLIWNDVGVRGIKHNMNDVHLEFVFRIRFYC